MPNGDFDNLTDREMLVKIYGHVKEHEKAKDDHEERLRGLEKWSWMLKGAWAFVMAWLGIHTLSGK